MNEQIIQPCKELKDYVSYFWAATWREPIPETEPTFYATANSLTEIGFGFNESGLMFASVKGHTAHYSSLPVGGLQELFGVSIHSYAVPFLFHLPALEFSNRFFSPETLFGNEGKLLIEKILTASTTEQRVHILTEYFKLQLKKQRLGDPLASNAVQRIRQHNGLLNITDLADDFNLSKKQFERRFKAGVGFNPKLYARIVRFETILNNRTAYANLTEATYANGYYDQAHLIRDFKAFTGYSPNKFFAL